MLTPVRRCTLHTVCALVQLPSMSPKKAPETPKHEPSEMEQAIMKRQQQSEVAQISQRINAVSTGPVR